MKNLSELTPKTHLAGLSFMRNFWRESKVSCRSAKWSSLQKRLDEHVINICFNIPAKLVFENMVDQVLICGPGIFEMERHDPITAHQVVHIEGSLVLVIRIHLDLVVPQICIHEAG